MERDQAPTMDLIRAQLRRLRIAAGMSQEELGKMVHYSGSHVSAVELGTRTLEPAFLGRADEVLDTGDLLTALLKLARRDGQPVWFRPWIDAEQTAIQLRNFQPTLVPGLLQTEHYARTILRGVDTLSDEQVERRVAARMERQKALTGEHPPQFVAVLDEAALRFHGSGVDGIMAQQIAHLIACAELPHVHVHIIPAGSGLHIGLSGPLALARSADGDWVGFQENHLGGVVVDREDGVAVLLTTWESVRNEALPRQQSIDLMKEAEARHGPQ